MPTTLRDIARHTGLSVSSISNILRHDDERYSAETRERVHKVAERLDYHPHHGARSMLLGSSCVIGVVMPDFTYSFFPQILHGIENKAFAAGYQVLVCQTHYEDKLEAQRLTLLRQHRVDGLIICPVPFSDKNLRLFRRIKKSATPAVCVDSRVKGVGFDYVGTDDATGVRMAINHLVSLGHTRIGCLSFGDQSLLKTTRLKAYRMALYANDIPFDPAYVIDAPWRIDEPAKALLSCVKSATAPTAFFAMSDTFAVWAYFALKDAGIRVPDDIALVGYGGIHEGQWLDMPLTTVQQPCIEMGREAVKQLLKRFKTPASKTAQNLLRPTLLVRGSCGAQTVSPHQTPLHSSPIHPHSLLPPHTT